MAKVPLTLAIGEYDHVRDLFDGTVPVAGVDLNVLRLPVEEMFYRFLLGGEFDVSEVSFGKIAALAAQDDRRFVALPVFPSRVFRHSSIYVRSDGGISRPEQLAGKRVGVPEWAQTAAIYSRGLLAHEYGVDLTSIHWHQAGVNEPGRHEKVALELPSGFRLTVVADRSLSDMLLAGDLDAVLSARPPAPIAAGDPRVRRLVRRLSRRRARVCAQDRHFPDHARDRDAARNLRARPLAGHESVHGVRRGKGAQPRDAPRT